MKITSNKAFAIIELLVGIFIFSLGLVSIYAIIITTIRINDFNSNYIVATNLAKEQIELIRNVRDSNYQVLKPFDLKEPDGDSFDLSDKLKTGNYYTIENIFGDNNTFPILITDINTGFLEGKQNLNSDSMKSYRLCLNNKNLYTYDCSNPDNKKTEYYRFFYVDELKNFNGTIDNAYKITSKVVWYKRGYHKFEINTVLADWKRL